METKTEPIRNLSNDYRKCVCNSRCDYYDNHSDYHKMDNHKNREEVIYYSIRLEDGTILRLASVQSSIWALIGEVIKPSVLIFVVITILAGLLAAKVSKKIVRPLNNMDLNNPMEIDTYEELNPFLHRIHRQNKIIDEQVKDLKRKQEEFSVITENMQEGFLLVDKSSEVLSYNSAALRFLDATKPEENESIFAMNRSESFHEAVAKALEGMHSEQRLQNEQVCYDIIANPVFVQEEISGVVILILDVKEKEMRERLRREFTSNVSHELKTPLTSIYGVADMLAAGLVKAEDVPRFAGDIHREAKRMIHLIEDIIRLSQLDEQSVRPEKQPVDLMEMALVIQQSLQSVCDEKQVTMKIYGDEVSIIGVPTMIEEVLYNLCENAIKYNKEGGNVEVAVIDEPQYVKVMVKDTGIGIPTEHHDRIFERFYRVEKSHSRKIGGTGLGLSIVKHALQYHNAEIELASKEGVGTTMMVSFPK